MLSWRDRNLTVLPEIPNPHLLENGVTVYLPSWEAYDEKGADLEGVGITPDVVIPSADRDFENRDPVLAKAISGVF